MPHAEMFVLLGYWVSVPFGTVIACENEESILGFPGPFQCVHYFTDYPVHLAYKVTILSGSTHPFELIVRYNGRMWRGERKIEEEWTVVKMSDDCRLGVTRFTHYCKEITNCSPMEYLNRLRLRKASKIIMSETKTPIIDVAFRCGFSSTQYFNYAFRYDKNKFKGLAVKKFRSALEAELGIIVDACYEPLNNCTLYVPHTKPARHKLNETYWAAIDPTRFKLPVCERIFEKESVCLHHKILLDGIDSRSIECKQNHHCQMGGGNH